MRVGIAVVHTRPFSGRFVDSLNALVKPKEGYHWIRVPDLPVDLARNEAVRSFLAVRPKLEYLLQIDSDMGFAPRSLQRLMERDVQLVSGLCITRSVPPVPAVFGKVTRRDGEHEWLRIQTREIFEWLLQHPEALEKCPVVLDGKPKEDGMVRENGAGAAFLLAHRDVFETVGEPWFKRDALKKGEDFNFFQRCRKAGVQLWVDRSVILGHEWGAQYAGPRTFMVYALGLPLLEMALKEAEQLGEVDARTIQQLVKASLAAREFET